MAITLFAGALRYLGLSQQEAADMLRVGVDTVKHWGSGRRPVPEGVWDELRRFAKTREVHIARLQPYTFADAEFVLGTMGDPPDGFPCADSYVTTLAAAVLRSGVDAPHP